MPTNKFNLPGWVLAITFFKDSNILKARVLPPELFTESGVRTTRSEVLTDNTLYLPKYQEKVILATKLWKILYE